MKYNPTAKHHRHLQQACLEMFWPKYFAYPGSRSIPKDLPPGSPRPQRARDLAVFRRRLEEVEGSKGYGLVCTLLGKRAALHLRLATMSDWAAIRTFWKFGTLLALVGRDVGRVPVWTLCDDGEAGSDAAISASPVRRNCRIAGSP